MGHPYAEHRQTKKEHSRVGHITRGYKSGGAVHGAKAIGKKALALHREEHAELHAEGGKSKHRMDRPKRAKGGKVKGKHNERTVINVIAGGHPAGGAIPAGPPMAPPGPPMGIAPAAMAPPPMAAKPPMMPPGAGAPSPMPMRAKGGKVKHRADGGASDSLQNPFMPSGRPPPSQDDFTNILKSNPKLLRILQNASKPPKVSGGKVRHRAEGGGLDDDSAAFMSKSISDPATKVPGKLRNPFGYGKIKPRSPLNVSGPTPIPTNQYARGGKVTKGTKVFEEGQRNGTPVQHMRGKGDLEQMGRGKQITFESGGRVRSFYAKGGSVKNIADPGVSDRLHMGEKFKATPKEIRDNNSNTTNDPTIGRPSRARGGMCRANGGMADKVASATKLPGGSGGGEARLAKARR
jgi:hypothetical protein